MGEIAALMLAGEICQMCGEELGEACGYPRTCHGCGGNNGGIASTPRQEEVANYLQVAEQHGWSYRSSNNGWHVIVKRDAEQIDVWLSSKRGPRWNVHGARGKAKPVHLGLIEALTLKETP